MVLFGFGFVLACTSRYRGRWEGYFSCFYLKTLYQILSRVDPKFSVIKLHLHAHDWYLFKYVDHRISLNRKSDFFFYHMKHSDITCNKWIVYWWYEKIMKKCSQKMTCILLLSSDKDVSVNAWGEKNVPLSISTSMRLLEWWVIK